jgi:YD repeat-containing protein
MTYSASNGQWVCTQIKDRNGNYLTINYNSSGNISTIVDTLERTITFNYDGNAHLQTITQLWTVSGSSVTHTWATFSYDNITIDTNFSGVYMLWPQDNATMSVLTEVAFADSTHIEFEYNAFGQVNKVKGYASNDTLQSQTRYIYDTPSADVPRVTDRYDWARYWNGDIDGTVASGEEARTQFTTGFSGGVMTASNNTIYKEFYASSGWQRGLTTSTEIWVSSSKEKWTTASWTQDNTSVSYFLNPRVDETNVYDSASNRRRTTITYTDYSLPDVVTEYEANASTVYRKTDTDYVTSSTYINNRLIGLPAKVEIKDASNNIKAKTEFTYDSSGSYFTNVTGKDNHDDTNYGSGFVTGRGNLCVVKRYEIGGSGYIESDTGYNSLGQVVFARDGADHQTNVVYSDSFSDGINTRNTNAYPSAMEDADGNDYLTQYNYDFGGVSRSEDPLGAVVTQTYDSIGRRDATSSLASTSDTTKQARTRYEYGPNYLLTYVRGFDGTNEAYTNTQFDGAGRVRAAASDFPGSTGGYKAFYTYYDINGHAVEQINPTEVNSSWVPAGDDSAGFLSTTQTFDWKGRPLVTTNQDDTTKTVSYSGCGCAGGEAVTILDEVNRKQKLYSDVFGRAVKTQVYSDSTTVNSTVVTTHDLLDHPTLWRHYSGTDSSSTYQDTTFQYDGYGRPWKVHRPEFAANTYNTVTYNADDTQATVTDPRGVVTTFSYNARRLVTGISYSTVSGISTTPSLTLAYDAAGNRLSMSSSVAEVDYVYDSACE